LTIGTSHDEEAMGELSWVPGKSLWKHAPS
jgi:hypothetical protein